MAKKHTTDWFARIIAIFGLLVAVAAIVIPYVQSEKGKQENLSIIARPEGAGGILKLSDDLNKSRAVQVPWVFTVSNTGHTKLSIVSYSIAEIKDPGVQSYSGLDGGATDRKNSPITFPVTLDSGESMAFRIHIGFLPTDNVQKILRKFYDKGGALDAHQTLIELAKMGMTLYGGTATLKQFDLGGLILTIEPTSIAPVYRISFKTGRGNEFIAVKSAGDFN